LERRSRKEEEGSRSKKGRANRKSQREGGRKLERRSRKEEEGSRSRERQNQRKRTKGKEAEV
jgi:hypothetical protein